MCYQNQSLQQAPYLVKIGKSNMMSHFVTLMSYSTKFNLWSKFHVKKMFRFSILLPVLSYVPYDHQRLPFLTSDSESSCSNLHSFFICGQKSAIMDKRCWLGKISEIGRVTTHFVGNFMLIKNQQGQKRIVWQIKNAEGRQDHN